MPISFSYVNTRKLALQSESKIEKISYRTVSKNLSANNLSLFIESSCNDIDSHCKQSFLLYDRLLKESDVSNQCKHKLESQLISNLIKVSDLDSIYNTISSTNIDDKYLFFDRIDLLENCDRVIRNESRLSRRFDLQKLITENMYQGCRHTVFELCSLLDTYDISSKAKLNIALENVSYALFKSGQKIDLNEVTEYIAEYFLTRDSVITDKEYNGYINVLENNQFIDSTIPNISYIFEFNNKSQSFTDKAKELIVQCETKECSAHMSKLLKIKTEEQASKYIDATVELILNDKVTINDSLLLLKSIYCLPLIGNISKQFVSYKLEMSKKKLKIKKKLSNIENKKIVRDVLDDGEMIDYVNFVSESVHFKDYILDDSYVDETDPIKLLEAESSSDDIKDIINTFKACNEKSPSKFKNMISRIMTKSPENIIDGTPNIFAMARVMLYLGVSAAFPLGPIFAAILALINKLLTMHLDEKQAEKLLKHLESEKEKAEKKLDKLTGKEKDNQEEYIKCINDSIKKVKDFISKIDDENEEIYGDDDEDDFGFGDFDFESATLEFAAPQKILSMLSSPLDEEIITNIAPLFDNCSNSICDQFYKLLENYSVNESCSYVLENKLCGRLETDREEPSFMVRYEAACALQEILNEATKNNKKDKKKPTGKINLNTIKMAVINFKKKFRDLKGKEQEIWRNIDIATANLSRGIQKALTSDRREAIIKGSIIPSFSKCIKSAIVVGATGIFTGPVGAAITAVGMLAASKYLNERERKLLYDEIDTELQVVEKQIQLAENDGDMNQYRFLLNYQKKLQREKYRIKYNVHMKGRDIPEIKRGND